MNANIKKINDHTFVVDFRVIHSITEIKINCKDNELDIIDLPFALTNNGLILLNGNSQLCEMFKFVFKGFDQYDGQELHELKNCKEVQCENESADMLVPYLREFIGIEIDRRKAFKRYKKSNKGLSKVREFIVTKFMHGEDGDAILH